jgi:polyisoprenyl-teichoic acid--peptidoglycan teichoic acid transferase
MSKSSKPRKRQTIKTSSPVLGQYINANSADKAVLATTAEPEAKKPLSRKRLIWRLARAVIVIVIILGGWLGWRLYDNLAKATGDNNPLQIFGLFFPSKLNESNGRVNVLLAGYSVGDPGHEGAQLTDSIMVVSIDPKAKTAVMISIPRDTWVDIPGYGYSKINAAYEDGEQENFSQAGYDNGGMGLLEEVVYQNFGIQTDYDGLLNYAAFKGAVNAVGGITIDIQSPDPRGLYDPYTHLQLPNGPVTLNGQEALNLARARGDGPGAYGFPQGDFNRTQHQQQMMIAIKNKISKTSFIADPIRVSELANAVGNNFKTDMSLGVMDTLYKDSKGISDGEIQSVTLNDYNGHDLLASYYTPSGQDALVPAAGYNNFSQIKAAIQQILSQN